MAIKIITKRDLQGQNPLFPSLDYFGEFDLINMSPDGVWLVDKQFPDVAKIYDTARIIASTFGDTASVAKLNKLMQEAQNKKPDEVL